MDLASFQSTLSESRNGANHFVRHWANPRMQYSDGVEQLAATGCFWLLDIIATEVCQALRASGYEFGIFKVKAGDSKADLALSLIDDAPPAWSKHINLTDLPDGSFDLYLVDEGERFALILPTEY